MGIIFIFEQKRLTAWAIEVAAGGDIDADKKKAPPLIRRWQLILPLFFPNSIYAAIT